MDMARVRFTERDIALIGRHRSAFTSARTNSLRLRSSEQMRSLEASKIDQRRTYEKTFTAILNSKRFKNYLPESREMWWVTQVQVINDC